MAPKAAPKAAAPKAEAKAKAKADPKKKAEKKKDEEEAPRMQPPDAEAFQARIKEVQDQIDAEQKKQAALAKQISERSGGKEEFFAKKAELRAQLDEFSGKMNALQERKDELMKGLRDKNMERKEMSAELTKMKKSIGFTSEAEIDDRIASIEFKLWTDTISLKEEKKCLAEIQELKRNKPKVSQVHQMESKVENFDKDKGLSIKEKVNVINEEMAQWRAQKGPVSEKLTALMEERRGQLGDLPNIVEDRDKISKKIQDLVKDRNAIRDELKTAEREYYAYQAELRKARQEKQMEERKKQQEQWKELQREKKASKLDEQPYVSEITLIEQTILFCKSLMPTKEAQDKQEKKETVFDNPDGTQVLMKKEDREEFYLAPTSKGKKGKTRAKGGNESGSTKPIKHNAETFRLFDQLKLDAPITTDDIPPTLEKLEGQLKSYEEKVEQWRVNKEERKRRILEGQEDDNEGAGDRKEEAKAEEQQPAEEEEEVQEEAKDEEAEQKEEAEETKEAEDETVENDAAED